MAYQRAFDEEPTRVSEISCVNDGAGGSFELSLTTTTLTVTGVPPNIYRAFLDGMSPSATVAFFTRRTTGETLTLPTANTWGGSPDPPVPSDVTLFPGNTMVRIRVMSGKQVLYVRTVAGTGTLYLVPTLFDTAAEEE